MAWKNGLLTFISAFCLITCIAQVKPLQTLKGIVNDKSLKTALAGATIELMGNTHKNAIANNEGSFKFEMLPVGRFTIRISFIGYKTISIPNIAVESGKETYLPVEMEEEINVSKEVIVKSGPNKTRALNDAALVSARMFSVEETRRYAAGLNDPSRIATAFPGVTGNGDKNSLSIRVVANGGCRHSKSQSLCKSRHFWRWHFNFKCTVIGQFRFHDRRFSI
jgi:hypothetical protein